MATSQSKQALRAYRRENGLCIFCGATAKEGLTRCQTCSDKDKVNRKRYEARDAARGICVNVGCSNPVEVSHKRGGAKRRCEACIAKATERSSASWYKAVRAGMCGDCGVRPKLPDGSRCPACRDSLNAKAAVSRAKRVEAGLCSACGDCVLESGYTHCLTCINKGRQCHADRKLKVLNAYGGPVCVGCGETEVVVLQVDHIKGGGNKHAGEIGKGSSASARTASGRSKLYTWLIRNKFPLGFRVLCANCNIRAARGCLKIDQKKEEQ